MTRYNTSGRLRAWWLDVAPASLSALKISDITAGTLISPWLTRDGLKTPTSGTTSDAADIQSAFNKVVPGTWGGDTHELTFFRDDDEDNDVAWETFLRLTEGYLVVFRAGHGGGVNAAAPSIGDICQVYTAQVISQAPIDTADNATDKFTVMLAITDEPVLHAEVTAAS